MMMGMPMMQMGQMLPMAGAQGMPTVAAAVEPPQDEEDVDSDGELISRMREEAIGPRITATTEQLRQAEESARKMADSETFVGTLARYDPDQGFGFVVCPECAPKWGKADI